MDSLTAYLLECRPSKVFAFDASSVSRARGKAAKVLKANGSVSGKLYLAATADQPKRQIDIITPSSTQD